MSLEEHITELLPAYALDCLEEGEAGRVTEHLATCPDCRAELQIYQAIADQLPLGAPQVEPPTSVKDKLMERARLYSRQELEGNGSSWWGKLLVFFRQISPFWSMASLVLVVFLAASNLLLWRQVNRLNTVVQVGTMRVIELSHTNFAPQASGLIVISTDGEHGTLVVDRLPALGEGQDYQLWLIKDGKRTSGGVFSVSKDGYSSLWVSSPQPLASYASFGVTIEPTGGSPGPTGEKVLGGNS